LGIESDIIKQQRVRNKNNDFSSEISYAKRTEKKEIEQIMDDVRENDQCMFYVGVTMLLIAESKEELESVTESVIAIAKGNSVAIDTHYLKQREAMNTALPIGVRQVETMRTMLTQSLAVLLPFNVQELNDAGGNYYGINQISKNVNVGNRKKLLNGNGFIFGVPGSGKSFFAKQEMGNVFLNTADDVIVIDPMGEYFDIAHTFGGAVVNLSAYTQNYVNPLEADLSQVNEKGIHEIIADKSEFMLGLCDQLLGSALNPKHHSIIDRCVKDLYFDARKNGKVPLMSDFYHILKTQSESEAHELALCLELFVEGSLNIFNHHTNVDENNRFTVYGIQDLGSQLAPVAMLVMMEAIQSRIVENGRKGRATWLYIDECHVLLSSDYSATYLQQLWKKVRKQGGLCTGISQNVTDLLQNYIASTLISNSEFVALLKQSNIDSAKLAEVIGVSDSQLEFVNNSPSGTGLIKCGSVVIPFDNTIGKDTELYKLYNTNMHEKAEELKNQAETVQARKEDAGAEETGADTSLIRGCIASSMNQKKSAPESGFTPIVEQPAAKYNSWMIY
jgi:type IV secretory pathway VirB4 component